MLLQFRVDYWALQPQAVATPEPLRKIPTEDKNLFNNPNFSLFAEILITVVLGEPVGQTTLEEASKPDSSSPQAAFIDNLIAS